MAVSSVLDRFQIGFHNFLHKTSMLYKKCLRRKSIILYSPESEKKFLYTVSEVAKQIQHTFLKLVFILREDHKLSSQDFCLNTSTYTLTAVDTIRIILQYNKLQALIHIIFIGQPYQLFDRT